MRKIVILFSIVILPISWALAQEMPPPPPTESGPENPEIRKQLEQIKIWQMTKEMDLPTDKAEKFFPLYNNYNTELRSITTQRREAVRGLDSTIKRETGEVEVRKQVQQVLKLDAQMASVHEKFMQSLEGVLSPVEIGKYIVFEQKFDREIRERIRMIMQQRMRTGGRY
jgi:Spy/CpxP family protein refolding chaperone